ncbi:MAG: NAD(P)H-dependent oxidoreductase, partial [Syntrophobacteraceae bacterium]|nr:NAD(P)H-dependent oxidoreductase [Syntrophobacteraceae bacterium]
MKAEKALIIYGSPKGMKGSAANLADYFASKLQEKGLQVEKVGAYRSLTNAEEKGRLLDGFDKADVVLVCFPLYVDTLPAGLLAALRIIIENGVRISIKER